MSGCTRPHVDYPCRVPIKVFGHEGQLQPEAVAALVTHHLGLQPPADAEPQANRKGRYISFTFWVTLPDEASERPLREAIALLPGYVMQL
ncbi:DUF493 domain-containing protein [Holophaga foetida]|uniref:DUF493 domain-containing protein n=1 Tax=Holophaga foetida TaxID=35839 RepID=UPI000247509A|nr:DUF493 domain-containing protein [Holophaga foetida]